MSSWLSHAADLLARVAMNRLRLAFCSRASELAILGAVVSTCSRSIAGGAIWYPFFSKALGDGPTAWRPHLLSHSLANAAPAGNQHQQASRRPSPRRAPLPRRRVRRGCADPAPPAGPSGAAGSGQPLGTLRSPPRPRGGANRAGERVPRSCSTIARGGVAVQRKYGR